MMRSFVFLMVALVAAQSVVGGELRTGRGVRRFQIVDEGEQPPRVPLRSVFRTVSMRQELGQDAEPEAEPLTPLTEPNGSPETEPRMEAAENAVDDSQWDSTNDIAYAAEPCDCGTCSFCGNYWADADFLLWWRRAQAPPVLASTNFLPAGQVLFGGENLGQDARAGARFEVGGFLHYDHVNSIVGRFWALGNSQVNFDSSTLGNVSVIRPFIDVEPGSPTFNQETGLPINNIGGSVGSMRVRMDANAMGGDFLYRHQFHNTPDARGDVLIGYHGSRIDEDIVISQQFTNQGVLFSGRDVFNVKNNFHGLVLGVQVVTRRGPWTVDFLGKIAMGDVHQRVDISGFETRDDGVSVETTEGSLLALPTNIGFRERNKFAVAPELAIESSWQALDHMELSMGYTFLYWSDVMQAGETIDRTVNGSQTSGGALNGVARPEFVFQDGTYWVHGLNFGMTVTY